MPVDGTDTKPVPSDIRTTYRNSYNYECKEGYERASKSAEMMTSCDQHGRWTLNSPPICKSKISFTSVLYCINVLMNIDLNLHLIVGKWYI